MPNAFNRHCKKKATVWGGEKKNLASIMSRGSVAKNFGPRVQLISVAQFSSSRTRSRLKSAASALAARSSEANANCHYAAPAVGSY